MECDRIAALSNGKIIAIGPVAEVIESDHPWVKSYFQGKRARILTRATN